jgi:hypothetical protein
VELDPTVVQAPADRRFDGSAELVEDDPSLLSYGLAGVPYLIVD